MPDKSSRAAGQVFDPYRPHKSLHVLGRRLKTKVLVTGLEVTRRPDMPSKPVWGRELPGGFDSRPPPRGENGEMLWSSRGFASSPRSHYVHPRFVQTTTAWLVRYDIDPQAHRRQPPQALSPDPRGQLRCLTDAPILRRGHSDCRTFVTARTSGSPVRARTSPVPTHLGSSRCPDQRRLGFLLCSLRLRVEISGRDEGVGRAPHLPFTRSEEHTSELQSHHDL